MFLSNCTVTLRLNLDDLTVYARGGSLPCLLLSFPARLEFTGFLGLIAAVLKFSTDGYILAFIRAMFGFGLVLVALASYAGAKAGHISASPERHHHHRKAHRE